MMTKEEVKQEIDRLTQLVLDDRNPEIERRQAKAKLDELEETL